MIIAVTFCQIKDGLYVQIEQINALFINTSILTLNIPIPIPNKDLVDSAELED